MKKIIVTISSILFVAAVCVLVLHLRKKVNDIAMLSDYSSVFEKEKIAENFRTLQHQYPAIKIDKSPTPYSIPENLKSDMIPRRFSFNGKIYDIAEEINKRQLTSLIIIKDGNIVYENYYRDNHKQQPVILFSCTKSMMSLLIGIAYEKGFIKSLTYPAVKYAPQLKGTVYEQVTIQNLLNMASGVKWNEDYADLNSEVVQSLLFSLKGSLNDYTKKMTRMRPQGTFNQYISMDTQVLGMIIAGATRQPLDLFFRNNLWSKIHAQDDAYFLTDKTGFPLAYGGLIVSTRDLAKVGLLMLNGGKNNLGESLFSERWIKESITPTESYSMPGKRKNSDAEEGYKNQWWIPIDRDGTDFSAIGIYGQTLYINPEKRIIIASNSAYTNYTEDPDADSRRLKMFQTIAKHVDSTAAKTK